jgi:hypothetical protein
VAVASYDNDATLKGSAMPKLKYNASWTEDDEVAIDEALGLTEEQGIKLFTQKGTIVITAEQATALVALADKDEEAAPAATPEAPEGTPKEGDKDAKVDETPDVVDVHIVTQRERAATEMGEKLSEATNTVLAKGYEARETVNITPLLTYLAMVADLGKPAVQAMPKPNTYLKDGATWFGTGDKKVKLATNEPYDKYSAQDLSGKKPKKVPMSYYKTEALATKEGKKWQAELQEVDKALAVLKENKLKTVPEGKWKGFAKAALARRSTLYTSRITYIQGALGRAVKLAHQCYAFDSLSGVKYSFDQEKVGEQMMYVNRNEPVQIWDVTFEKNEKTGNTIEKHSDPINLSIGAFLKFDVAEAIKIAGSADKVTYETLAKTVERDTQTETPGTKEADWSKHAIENVAQFENIMSSLAAYISDGDGDVNGKRLAAIEKRVSEKDGEEFLLVIGDTCAALDDFWTRFEKSYLAAAKKRNDAKVAERQAREKIAA